MPDVTENPFTPLPNVEVEAVSDGVVRSAGDIAAEAAHAAIHGEVGTTPPGTEFKNLEYGSPDAPLLSEEAQHPSLEGTDPVVLDPVETPPVVDPTAAPVAFTVEDYQSLQEMGVNLPISPADVPAEFLTIYAEMAQNAMDTFHSNQKTTLDAQEAIIRVKDFTERLGTNEGQNRMLLTMAMNNPDVFANAMETVNRMKEDPEYGESIRRGLEADVKMEAATRKEKAIDAAALQNKGQQIESRTVRLAARLGIDAQVAKDLVAHRIMQNETNYGKRDISFEEVDQILQTVATRTNSRLPAPVADPATVAAAAQAPVTPGQAVGQTPTPQDPKLKATSLYVATQGAENAMETLRNAVKISSTRIRTTGL